MFLTGIVEDIYLTTYQHSKNKRWHILLIRVEEYNTQQVYYCQLQENNPWYTNFVKVEGNKHTISKDIIYHEVSVEVFKIKIGKHSITNKQAILITECTIDDIGPALPPEIMEEARKGKRERVKREREIQRREKRE